MRKLRLEEVEKLAPYHKVHHRQSRNLDSEQPVLIKVFPQLRQHAMLYFQNLPKNLNSSMIWEDAQYTSPKNDRKPNWSREMTHRTASCWSAIFLKLSISNLLIFAFFCTWEHFLLSFVAEFTSCPEQCRSLCQLMLSCSWYIVSLWVFFWWDEYSAFYHTQTEFDSLIIPHSPSHSQPKIRAKHSCWLPGYNQDSFWLDKLTLPTILLHDSSPTHFSCFISCTIVAQAFSQV